MHSSSFPWLGYSLSHVSTRKESAIYDEEQNVRVVFSCQSHSQIFFFCEKRFYHYACKERKIKMGLAELRQWRV